MKVIIAGSRSITDPLLIRDAIHESGFHITEGVCGGAAGVDALGKRWCEEILRVPVKDFLAKWTRYGRGAGMVRNQQMAWYADALIAVWDGHSPGTKHMIEFMERLKKPVYIKGVF